MCRIFLLAVLALAGCARPGQEQPKPLTLADWEAMPAKERFSVESLERLREGEPRFADEAEWEGFLWNVVTPRRKQELPDAPEKRGENE